MPHDLPGFYYDAEKNRYFPLKSRIPGSSSSSSSSSAAAATSGPTKPVKAKIGEKEIADKVVKMLHKRELCGNSICYNKKKVNFQEQYRKIQTSKPIIWKYQETETIANAALEHVWLDVQTADGLTETEILVTGGSSGLFGFYKPGSAGQLNYDYLQSMPDLVQPLNIETETTSSKSPGLLSNAFGPGAHILMQSRVSCIKISKNYYSQPTDVDSTVSHALITTLGSETSGGSVNLINLSEPFDYGSGIRTLNERMNELSRFNSTVWAADISSDGNQAVIGANIGAALVHMESGRRSWICRSESDILSLQFDSSGNVVLCGLRNGAIVTVDTRQKPQDVHDRLPKHEIRFPSLKTISGRGQKRDKRWFEVRGNVHHSRMMYLPSSVSCLARLKLYDQYFLASSMDGTVRLYDHRLTQNGAVQFYEGNVNSHTRIQMGVDPSERFFMTGGEDFHLRVWSIKSGEMLYEDKFMNSVPSVVCWPRGGPDCNRRNHFPVAWLGSQEGLFYVNTS